MNTKNSQTNTGAETNSAVTNTTTTKRGRKPDYSKVRKLYVVQQGEGENLTYVPRKKGAPKPNSIVHYVEVYRGVTTKDFVYNNTMEVKTETVGARNYKTKPVTSEPTVTVHETVNGTKVTETSDTIVVGTSEPTVAVA